MKKFLASFMAVCLFALNIMPAFSANAKTLNDVSSSYWAQKEIRVVVDNNIMTLDSKGNFNPENSVSRLEFVQALLKLLSNDNLDISIKNSFTDINQNSCGYADILRSEQLGLVYGYPDKTFRPDQTLLRSETTSIISHITKDAYTDIEILKQFNDLSIVPEWALNAYSKTTKYGLYVNYPDVKMLNPNKELTRAEAAVLLAKLRERLQLVKDKYKQEHIIGVEHINVTKKAPNNEITVTNLRKIILKNNVLSIAYDQKFWSKKAKAGDTVNFIVEQNLYTEEGTLLLPANTKLVATVLRIDNPKKFNKNARVKMNVQQLVMPDGKVYPIDADPFTKDRLLKEGPWMTVLKLAGYTVGVGGIGAGAGVGFAFIPTPAKLATGFAIGIPVGCTVGLVTGLLTPGLHYKAKVGENLLIILNDDTSVWNN